MYEAAATTGFLRSFGSAKYLYLTCSHASGIPYIRIAYSPTMSGLSKYCQKIMEPFKVQVFKECHKNIPDYLKFIK